MRAIVVLPLVLGACLSKPDRPSGADAATDADVRPDAPPLPDFTYRRDAEVADVNGDGFEDLVRWGNEEEGQRPRVWVHYGSATGLSPTPSLSLDVEVNQLAMWHEVLDVSVKDYRMPALPELIVLVAEDAQMPNGTTPVGRDLHVQVWNPLNGGLTMAIGRSAGAPYDGLGGLATASTPAYVAERQTSVGGHEIVFGGLDVAWRLVGVGSGTTSFGVPEVVELHSSTTTTEVTLVQDLFDAPGPENHLLAVDQGFAWSSEGDVTTDIPPQYVGGSTPFVEGNRRRAVRDAAETDPMVLAAEGEGSMVLQIVQDQPNLEPLVFALTLQLEEPVDFAIGNLGGTGQLDVITLDNDRLIGYIDLDLESGLAMPTDIIDGPSGLLGYNLLAIGNFSNAGNGKELYVLGNDVPMRCIVFTGTTLEDCE